MRKLGCLQFGGRNHTHSFDVDFFFSDSLPFIQVITGSCEQFVGSRYSPLMVLGDFHDPKMSELLTLARLMNLPTFSRPR